MTKFVRALVSVQFPEFDRLQPKLDRLITEISNLRPPADQGDFADVERRLLNVETELSNLQRKIDRGFATITEIVQTTLKEK